MTFAVAKTCISIALIVSRVNLCFVCLGGFLNVNRHRINAFYREIVDRDFAVFHVYMMADI